MRKSSIYRLLKRSLLFLPVIWMLYALTELLLKPNSEDFELKRWQHKIEQEMNEKRDVPQQATPKHHIQENNHIHNNIRKHVDAGGENAYDNNQEMQQKQNKKDGIEYPDAETLMKAHAKGQHQEKLAEMGGKLLEKRPSDYLKNVTLPPFNDEKSPTGPGEGGAAVSMDVNKLSDDDKSKYHAGWGANSFNQYVSVMISIHRSLPDGRSQACKEQAQSYSQYLQEISVIIIFHNEAWTVLLRSVHSILSRTPEHLLKEIILVDDLSTKDHLKEPLEKYFNDFPKVHIVRATKRQGLTRARLLGYFVSTAPVLVFLDSHIECFPGWAEPLCARIHSDPTVVAFPVIEVIADEGFMVRCNTFFSWAEPLLYRIGADETIVGFPSIEVIGDEDFNTQSNSYVSQHGVFALKDLTFQWDTVPEPEMSRRRDDADPIRSPTMPGGLFAISRVFFEKLGTYDSGLDYWGGENIELSFKAWMCGGSVELVTCSHIGHIFRRMNPIRWTHNIGSKNSVRVAEVWMDDYKNYFYERILYNLGDYGNVTERKELRKSLNCKSFEWYLRNVYPNLVIPSNMIYAGEIRSEASPRCVDSMGTPQSNQPVPKMYPCHGQGYNQFWHLSGGGQILQDDWHICSENDQIASKTFCQPQGPTWQYREDKTLYHIPTRRCLTATSYNDDLKLADCSESRYQKWDLQLRRQDVKFPV